MIHRRLAVDSRFVSPKLARLHRQLSSEGIESLQARGDIFEGLEAVRSCIVTSLRSPESVVDQGSPGGDGPQQRGRTLVPDLASPSSNRFVRNIVPDVLEVHPKRRLPFPQGVRTKLPTPALFLRIRSDPHATSKALAGEKITSRLEHVLKLIWNHSCLAPPMSARSRWCRMQKRTSHHRSLTTASSTRRRMFACSSDCVAIYRMERSLGNATRTSRTIAPQSTCSPHRASTFQKS